MEALEEGLSETVDEGAIDSDEYSTEEVGVLKGSSDNS